jgi:5-(carboxyamino)imidazole ribonucleotide synthase
MKLGLLGGGQLGRMLIQEAINWNIDFAVLDSDANAPCKYLTSNFTNGSITDYNTVLEFGKDKDIITIEIENVNADALMELERLGKKIYPQPNILKIIQDKGLQKMFYHEYKFPTAEFILTETKKDVTDCYNVLPFVQKLRKGGYDGKGVKVMNTVDDLQNAFDAPSVLEKKVDFKKELSVIVARNAKGEVAVYNSVECVFDPKLNLVDTLISPASVSAEIEHEAQQMALKIIETLGMVGILAVEFFLTQNDKLLVNEIAPRPHNSGHHTIEANITSQYQQQLRAILNYPLGNSETISAAAMVNIIGEEGYEGKAIYNGLENVLEIKNIFVHLYGKELTKPFRKMGHATVLGTTTNECLEKTKKIKQLLTVIA